ncbi:unnamed protein product [Bursaphelenchus xylophilus]|uniref:(pine wood nematode) hypothetical protein n=1 Tax=Bursaphelenchus xylophilus TaxID=6326 RepID=A0A1I7S181_BURXY|nr:unnamed protein product [Bursaphelenchus xylophilus]CAG9080090.1 unnamed protein product [Bursaphelenchus xylophilus]
MAGKMRSSVVSVDLSVSSDCCSRKRDVEGRLKALKEKVIKNPEKEDRLFGDPYYADFKIKAGRRVFHIAKYQLALKSVVFERLLKSDMRESNEGVLKLDDGADAVEAMLKFVYMYTPVKGGELARKVIQLAHRYELEELKDQCELEIIETLTMEDARDSLLLANQLELPLLFTKCNEFLYFNFDDFNNNNDVVVVDLEAPLKISVEPNEILLVQGQPKSHHKIKNHSSVEIAYKFCVRSPGFNGSIFKVVGPKKAHDFYFTDFLAFNFVHKVGIYYVEHVKNKCIDYTKLDAFPDAKFIPLHLKLAY